MDWAWTKPHELDREGKRRGPEAIPRPNFHLPFLYFVIYWSVSQGRWVPIPRGKGAGLPSWAACGERLPPPLSPQSRGPSLPSSSERRGGGTRCYKPRPLCHSVPPRPLWSPVAGGRLRTGPSPQCLVSPGPLRPPCCGRVRAPGVGGAELRSSFPSGPGVCMGESSFHEATGRCGVGGGRAGEPLPQVGLPAAGITQ
ncbi:hypothetical protein HJG60_009042 [Phyllostomus discolor]|uniref:Uncharacterized protein n=1 Tax=Phyllostomus discolor TaxID=89673 RepID=A0A833YPN4_9CHIR|nr:hypothetical protein HJG60_009042 [Phyllostomus discolor]